MLCLVHTVPWSSAFVYLVVTSLSQAYSACVLPVVPEGYSWQTWPVHHMFQSLRGVPAASAFCYVIPVTNECCISHSFHLNKFVLFILPSSFEAHTMHYNDVPHIVYAILSTHLTSESASGMCPLYWLGWSYTIAFHGIKYLCMTSEQGRCNCCLFFSSGNYNVWNALQETQSQPEGWLGEETSGCCQATQQVQQRGQTNSATTLDIAILHAGMAWAWVEATTIATCSEEHTWPPQVCCWAWVEHPCLADTAVCLRFWAVTMTSLLVSKGT